MKLIGVLLPIIHIPLYNDGQEVFRFVYGVFINNLLHTFSHLMNNCCPVFRLR